MVDLVINEHTNINLLKSKIKNFDKLEIFNYWCYLRDVRYGLKRKKNSYKLFLALYDLYPEDCISLVENRIFKDIGYWKDIYLIWDLINNLNLRKHIKYKKYNKLIESFRNSIIEQRNEDLQLLRNSIKPFNLLDIDKETLRELLIDKDLSNLSYIGKYCIREKSKLNKKLYWYLNINDKLIEEDHVSYLIRGNLKQIIIPFNNKNNDYPLEKNVPPFCKKQYRDLNAKLNIALMVPENLMCEKRVDILKTSQLPIEFMIRNKRYLERQNVSLTLQLDKEKFPLSYVDYKNNNIKILTYLKLN